MHCASRPRPEMLDLRPTSVAEVTMFLTKMILLMSSDFICRLVNHYKVVYYLVQKIYR